VSADYFFGIGVKAGHFDYIIIDEAAQMLECDALCPLLLASPETCVVLSGDPLQMGPRIFSDSARNHNFGESIMERMEKVYRNKGIDHQITFWRNYRNNDRILHFPSKWFYGGQLRSAKEMKMSSFKSWSKLKNQIPLVKSPSDMVFRTPFDPNIF